MEAGPSSSTIPLAPMPPGQFRARLARINRRAASRNGCGRPHTQTCSPGAGRTAPHPILHHMANHRTAQLDRTFAALMDPTRRAILARLEREAAVSVSDLARPFAIKLPAVMKHLDVLGEAGLVSRAKAGRVVTVRLSPEPMREALEWLRRYERFWGAS